MSATVHADVITKKTCRLSYNNMHRKTSTSRDCSCHTALPALVSNCSCKAMLACLETPCRHSFCSTSVALAHQLPYHPDALRTARWCASHACTPRLSTPACTGACAWPSHHSQCHVRVGQRYLHGVQFTAVSTVLCQYVMNFPIMWPS